MAQYDGTERLTLPRSGSRVRIPSPAPIKSRTYWQPSSARHLGPLALLFPKLQGALADDVFEIVVG
jgi:hypothetical protein